MRCPACDEPMVETVERGVTLDRCTDCRATFFDPGELGAWAGGVVDLETRQGMLAVGLDGSGVEEPGTEAGVGDVGEEASTAALAAEAALGLSGGVVDAAGGGLIEGLIELIGEAIGAIA